MLITAQPVISATLRIEWISFHSGQRIGDPYDMQISPEDKGAVKVIDGGMHTRRVAVKVNTKKWKKCEISYLNSFRERGDTTVYFKKKADTLTVRLFADQLKNQSAMTFIEHMKVDSVWSLRYHDASSAEEDNPEVRIIRKGVQEYVQYKGKKRKLTHSEYLKVKLFEKELRNASHPQGDAHYTLTYGSKVVEVSASSYLWKGYSQLLQELELKRSW